MNEQLGTQLFDYIHISAYSLRCKVSTSFTWMVRGGKIFAPYSDLQVEESTTPSIPERVSVSFQVPDRAT